MSVTDSVSMQTAAIDKELLMPDRLFVAGNNLVVYQPKEEEGIFTVFPLPFDGKGCRTGHIGRDRMILFYTHRQAEFCSM